MMTSFEKMDCFEPLVTVGVVCQTNLKRGARGSRSAGSIRMPMLLLFDGFDRLRKGPDVVVCEAQSFDLGEFGLFGESRQDGAEAIQCVVQHVHPVALAVVGFDAARLLDADQLRRTPGSNTRFTVALLLHRNPR